MKPQRNRKPKPKEVPFYDPEVRELWFRGQLVKRFRQRAGVQELILISFQEHRWKRVIYDPLPPVKHIDPNERLHQAINNLNRGQKLLHFVGTGTGTRIGWEPVE